MGIEDREYIRRPAGGMYTGGGFGASMGGLGLPPVCKWLVIANIAVFVLQLVWTRPVRFSDLTGWTHFPEVREAIEELPPEERQRVERSLSSAVGRRISVVQDWLELDPDKAVFGGQIWRLLTYAFCHDRGSPWHIIINMWVLWMFAPTLERMYGSREFLAFYITAAFIAAAAYLGLAFAVDQTAPMIGASGAVLAAFVLFAWHYPNHTILLFFVFPIEVRWLVLAYAIFDLMPVLRQIGGEPVYDGVAHAAHLGGLAFGFLYGKNNLQLSGALRGMRMPSMKRYMRRRNLRLYEPPREDLEMQVDRILQKIHEHGEASLSESERAVLKEASQRYKKQ